MFCILLCCGVFYFGQKASAYIYTRTTSSVEKSLNSYKSHSAVPSSQQLNATPKIVKQKRGILWIFGCAVKFHREMSRAHKEVPRLLHDASQHTRPYFIAEKIYFIPTFAE